MWDNNSSDGVVATIKKELNNFSIQYALTEHKDNIGFSGGHNKLLKNTKCEYVLWLNPDVYLMPDCLEHLVQFLDTHADVAAVSPRLMKWDFEKTAIRLEESFTDTIDSLGLKIFRSRRAVEKYTGKQWRDMKPKMKQSFRAERFRGDTALEVFGLAGTLPMFRRSALEAVAFPDGTVLDELYGSYKEDVDLAFRLQSQGYKTYVLLETVAYHARATGGPQSMSDLAAIKNKRTAHSDWIKYQSYKNHLMTLYKNEYWQNVLLDLPWIFWYEIKKFGYFFLFDRAVLKGLRELKNHRTALRQKKKHIQKNRRLRSTDIRRWWG